MDCSVYRARTSRPKPLLSEKKDGSRNARVDTRQHARPQAHTVTPTLGAYVCVVLDSSVLYLTAEQPLADADACDTQSLLGMRAKSEAAACETELVVFAPGICGSEMVFWQKLIFGLFILTPFAVLGCFIVVIAPAMLICFGETEPSHQVSAFSPPSPSFFFKN